jgi:transposase
VRWLPPPETKSRPSPARPGTAGPAGSPITSPRPWPSRGCLCGPSWPAPNEGSIRLAAAQLLLLRTQRKVWEKRMGELLLGAPRTGRDKTPKDADPGKGFPGGEIYLSMPGLGDRLAARVAGEIGEHYEQFTTPNALQCYAGRAPVTRRSGRSEFTIARRLAYNRHLGEAVQQWAFCSLNRSAWARDYYNTKIAAGNTHHAALRKLGNRWLEVLWHCLRLGVPYNEATHTANRTHTVKSAA